MPQATRNFTTSRRAPQCLATTIRKVEPMGHGMVRMFFAVESGGGWEDRAVIEMPCASIAGNFAFAVEAVREIDRDIQLVEHRGTVN